MRHAGLCRPWHWLGTVAQDNRSMVVQRMNEEQELGIGWVRAKVGAVGLGADFAELHRGSAPCFVEGCQNKATVIHVIEGQVFPLCESHDLEFAVRCVERMLEEDQ